MTAETTADTLRGVTVDETARQRLVARRTPAARRHVIYFTPRSGSSWLSTALAETKLLGYAGEYLNPSFIQSIARSLNANTPDTYLDALLRSRKTDNDVFTVEVTYFHLRKFGDRGLFLKYFPPTSPCVFLMRENIVLQAISLYKAVETQVFHTAAASDDRIAVSHGFSDYDGEKILGWVQHIRQQEVGLEALFAVEKLEPLRISYERLFGMYPDPVGLIAGHLGLPPGSVPKAETRAVAHAKLASASNLELEARFRADYGESVGRVESERREMIARLYANGAARRSAPPVRTGVRKAPKAQTAAPPAPKRADAPPAPKPAPSLSQKQILQLAGERLRAGKPFSAIRFGDGEGMFLGGDGSIFPPSARNEAFKVLFGTEAPANAISDLGERMKSAYRDADVVGGPALEEQTNYRRSRAARVFTQLSLKSDTSRSAHSSFHQNIFGSGLLADLIRAARRVVIVTPHPVAGHFRERFGVDVELIRIPGEAKHLSPSDRHYPDRFREVCARLRGEDQTGCLALVGAGFCGKVYCGVFKQAGGVAIDVGSAFDELAGFTTRAYMSSLAGAEQMLERVSSLPIGDDPYSARLLFFKSLHLEKLGRLDEALNASRESLKRSPVPTERGIFHHMSLLTRQGRSEEANLMLHRICAHHPDLSRDAWQLLGEHYFLAGNQRQSAVAFEQAYALDRTSLLVLKRYVAALLRAGERKEVSRLKGEVVKMADLANDILAMISRAEGGPRETSDAAAPTLREPVAKKA
ncbi:Stf0 family sulfotransferase [Microbaculum marinum]|uniref:Stf0 family sulfotransferase n=1 Tax=Microbaculum marinum TaxID=1764581 RepID=A0AAW9RSY4_9HYPH